MEDARLLPAGEVITEIAQESVSSPQQVVDRIAALKSQGRKALIPYVTAGDPFADATVDIMLAMATAGAEADIDADIFAAFTDKITVVDIRGDKVRLGIDAPKSVPVHREEIYDAIKRGEPRKSSA